MFFEYRMGNHVFVVLLLTCSESVEITASLKMRITLSKVSYRAKLLLQSKYQQKVRTSATCRLFSGCQLNNIYLQEI